MAQIGSPSGLTAFNVVIPTGFVAETTTVVAVDLNNYIDDLLLILNVKRPNASAGTLAVTFLDSPDNTNFTALTSPTFANITTATETTATVSISRKAVQRYLQAKATTSSASSTGTYVTSIVGVGMKQLV